MHLENSVKLDFKDVLIRPKRSTLTSRSEVDITREFKFLHSSEPYHGIPIIAANMDTTGTFEMASALARHKMSTALHKHYTAKEYVDFFQKLENKSDAFYSLGIGEHDWQKFREVMAAAPGAIRYVCIDVANGFRTGGGDYAQLRRTMEQLAAAAGADVAQAAVEVRVPDETVQAAMEDAWAGETWQCGVTFAVRGGPTELALTWKDVTVTVGESGELWVKLSRPELAALTPDAAAAWLLEQYGAVFGEQTRYFMAARDSGGCSLYFYRPEEDLTQGILQRSILKTWVRLSGGSCELRLYRPELSDANTVGAYPLVTVDQARQRLAAGQHLSAWEPFPGEDRVKRVDLQYLARQTDRYFMPYYVFWVECDDGEQGVCYRPYYVPAVADAYIAGMPQSPTGAA